MKVRQAHEEFTLNLEVLPYGILVFHEKAIVGINEHLAKLVKRTKKELLLLSLPDLIFSEDLEKLSDNSANSEKHDVRLIDCDGNKIWCEIKVVNDLYRGSPATFFYINELTQQKINENTLNILMKRMAQAEESESFESMVVSLTEVLGFYYAFIGMYDEDTDEITIRAMSIANKLQDPFAYSVVDTPCGDVIRNGSLEIGLDTQCAYPEDHYLVEWDVDAYIGVALKNGDGKTIGHLAVMDTKPIENPSFVTSLLSFFSYRLGVKMEHELQQHELERSEKRYKCLFNDSFEAKVIYDRNISKIIEANDAAVRLFQYSKEAFKNMPISFIKPEKLGSGMMTVDQVRNNLKALDEGKKVHTETLSKRSDGTVFPTDITLSIFGTDKNLVIVSYRDMTEKKEAQRALEISEKRFRSLFEYSFDAIFLMNLETYIYENCNIRAIELFKYPKEKLLTMSPKDLVAPKQRDEIDPYQRVMENIQSLKNQKRLRFEFNFLKSNGEVFEAEVSLLPIINEHKTYCITTIKDISGKKRQEEALNRRKLFLRKVIDLNPNLIFSKDHQGKFTVANRATGEFLGVESTELIGKHWKQFYVVKEEADLIAKSDDRIFENGDAIESQLESLTSCHGIKRSLQTAKMPIMNEKGQVEQILSVSTDISPHVQMEKKLRDNFLELQKVNNELDHFVYRASHDLRAPLASILGFTNLTKSEESIDEIKLYNTFIEEQINKLDGFIRDIISYSRISRTELERDLIDFHKIINDVFDSLKFLEKSLDIRKQLRVTDEVAFYSDVQGVTFILKNLISNAIKYSRTEEKDSFINVDISINTEQAEVNITDNGIGIDNAYISYIFDMFYRATEQSDGSGLGLFIVKQSIEKLSGQIEVKSELGKGTEFKIILPNHL